MFNLSRQKKRVNTMNVSVSKPQKKRIQAVLEHASGDKRFKILEVHMKKHQFRQDALIEVLH